MQMHLDCCVTFSRYGANKKDELVTGLEMKS